MKKCVILTANLQSFAVHKIELEMSHNECGSREYDVSGVHLLQLKNNGQTPFNKLDYKLKVICLRVDLAFLV